MRSRYLVCYDIRDPRRLHRVFQYMKKRGVHLQLSVFLCSLTWPELQELKNGLSKLIHPRKDDVRIYPLPSGGKVSVLGLPARIPEGVDLFFADGSSEAHRKPVHPLPEPAEKFEKRKGVQKEG